LSTAESHVETTADDVDHGEVHTWLEHLGAAGLRLHLWERGVEMMAIVTNFVRMQRVSVTAVGPATHGCEYLPKYVVYTGYTEAKTKRTEVDVVSMAEEVGVAGDLLGFGQKMASNYPSLLSRIDAEKSQYGPGPEA
jgi:hypothetical protein